MKLHVILSDSKKQWAIICCLVFTLFVQPVWSATVQVRISNNNDDVEQRISDGNMYRSSSDLEMAYDPWGFRRLQITGLRFQSVDIPKGATVNSAYIQFHADESHSGATNLVVYGQDIDNASVFGASNFDVSSRTKTSANVSWTPSRWRANRDYQTPDITSIVQEIVNRPGWSANNSMAFMIEPGRNCTRRSCRRVAETYEGERRNAPLLVIDYTEGYFVSRVHGACGVDNLLVVEFDNVIDARALNTRYYSLNTGSVNSVTRQNSNTVVLSVSGIVPGQPHTLTVNGVDHAVDFSGLTGHYYDQRDRSGNKVSQPGGLFTGAEYIRKDAQINFLWDRGRPSILPNRSDNNDRFTVRWNGYIKPSVTGQYQFRLYSDDGMRMALEGTNIVSDWSEHAGRFSSPSSQQSLTSGVGYPIKVEFFEHYGEATSRLQWRRDGGAWEYVPAANLSSCAVENTPATMVAHYTFEQASWASGPVVIEDDTGNGNTGMSVGGAVTHPAGQVCKGVSIPANSDKAIIDAIDSGMDINDKLGSDGTIMLWYRAEQAWHRSGTATIIDATTDVLGTGQDKYFYLVKSRGGRLRFGLEDNRDRDFHLSTPVYRFGAGQWVHLAISWDFPNQTIAIFVNGSQVASRSINSTPVLGDLGNIYFGDNSSTYATTGRSANGRLDEIRLYDRVLTEDEVADAMSESHDCPSCTLGGFVVTQPEYGLSCPSTRAAVSVTAQCDDGITTKTDYLGTVSLSGPATSTFYGQATGGGALTQYTFNASDAGSKTFYLYYNNENPNVQTTVSDTLASVSSTASSGTDFRASGFLLSMDPADTRLACNESGNITLTAFGQTNNASGQECEVISGFTGNKDIDVWFYVDTDADADFDDTNRSMIVNGTGISANTSNSESSVLKFINGRATFPFSYQDVGKVKALYFTYRRAPYDGSLYRAMSASSGPLVFYPASFKLAETSGSPTHVAGAPFELGIQAQCASGADPVDYRPNTANTFQAALVRTSPTGSGVNEGLLTVKNGVTVGSSSSVSYSPMGLLPGDFHNSGYSYQADYSEVGQAQLHIRDANYFGVTNIPAASISMGRFIPDHFRIAGNTPVFANGDGSWACNMTYQGQAFEYAVDPQITLVAYNAKNQVTANYDGSLWRYGSNSFANRTYTNQAAVDSTLGVIKGIAPLFSYHTDYDGKFLATITGDVLTHNKVNTIPAAMDAPFATDIDLLLTVDDLRDADGVCVKANAASGCQSYSFTGITGNEIRYGRAKIENAFGPETSPLKIPMTIEHWTGSAYTTNTLDNCSAYSSATPAPFSLSGYQGSLSAGETVSRISGIAGAGDTFSAGEYVTDRAIELSAPGLGNTGSVITTHAVPSWLQFDWDGNGTPENPSGEAVFGQFRGHDRIIYWQEVTYD